MGEVLMLMPMPFTDTTVMLHMLTVLPHTDTVMVSELPDTQLVPPSLPDPHRLGKRSADALYGYGIVTVTTSTYGYGPSGYGIAQGHPGYASSFQQVTRLH